MSPFAFNIAMIAIFDLAAIICAKFWSMNKFTPLLIGTIVFFGTTGFFFARSLRYEGIAITNIIWTAASVILVTIFGYFFFKEQIGILQFIGIALVLTGLILVNLK